MSKGNLDIRSTDKVLIRLTLRSRSESKPLTLDEVVQVSDLDYDFKGATKAPEFDQSAFTAALAKGDTTEAMRIQTAFNKATAEAVASGSATPAERLATAVIDWVITQRPHGNKYVTGVDSPDGYILNQDEINIAGPHEAAGERYWRVTAVGTWGVCL